MCRRAFTWCRVVVGFRLTKRNGGSDFSKPPLQMGVSNGLLYDGFFSFAVVRQIDFYSVHPSDYRIMQTELGAYLLLASRKRSK